MQFTAIDFETANNDAASACAIGLVKVIEDRVADTLYSLIKPPTDYFFPMFIDIHGIDADAVKDAPSFRQFWPRAAAFIGDDVLVAHNYSFDKRVFESTLGHYGIDNPSNPWDCSLALSRRAWPNLRAYGLDIVAEFLRIDLNHHHALDDAKACALIYIAATKMMTRASD
ncbi:MAG TPA: 3'-5' exonuclease [Rectinemataceae bacterium]|nr:3'-5' exonuclease [Rectinemataceae bacterium]